jgi:hypothetical protein
MVTEIMVVAFRFAGKSRSVWIALLLLGMGGDRAFADIHFDNFMSGQNLSLVGNAKISGRVLRLTAARSNQTGAAWFPDKQAWPQLITKLVCV